MRRTSALLIRLICTLALIVAGLPLRASDAMACATSMPCAAPKAVAKCPMPCCHPEHQAVAAPLKHTCCAVHAHAGHHTLRANDDACKCVIVPLPKAPVTTDRAAASELTTLALPPVVFTLVIPSFHTIEPGVFGVDSGPPPTPAFGPNLGRAPPVAFA